MSRPDVVGKGVVVEARPARHTIIRMADGSGRLLRRGLGFLDFRNTSAAFMWLWWRGAKRENIVIRDYAS